MCLTAVDVHLVCWVLPGTHTDRACLGVEGEVGHIHRACSGDGQRTSPVHCPIGLHAHWDDLKGHLDLANSSFYCSDYLQGRIFGST